MQKLFHSLQLSLRATVCFQGVQNNEPTRQNAGTAVEDIKSDVKNAAADVADTAKNAARKVADVAEDAVDSARSSAKKVAETVKDAAEDAAGTVKETARSARRTASEAIDETGRHIRHADDESDSLFIDNLANRAQDLAERSIDFWADNTYRARRQFQATADATTRYVSEQPGRSVLIAAATGAALATAFFLGRSRKK